MKGYLLSFIFLLAIFPALSHSEMTGFIAVEGRGFNHSPLYTDNGKEQERHDGALILAPEFYKEFDDGSQFTFSPYYMEDSADNERSHGDIRELYYLKVFDTSELSFGVKKIFWGVTESRHVVDIINQTDQVSSSDGEDKLGQPMVHFSQILSLERELGTIDFFIMPYFRERTFQGFEGRLRGQLIVDTDNPLYESSKEENHIDYAVRYTNSLGPVDFSLSHFDGTSREPDFIPTDTPKGMVLTPYYRQINQTGMTTQVILGEWILKLEAYHKNGRDLSYETGTAGFEYTFTSIFGTKMDFGTLLEYHFDSRRNDPTPPSNPMEDDLMAGFRLAVNDLGSTEILGGAVRSLDHSAKYYFIEASRRLTDNIKINFEARTFQEQPEEDPLYFLHDDDHMLLEVAYYF